MVKWLDLLPGLECGHPEPGFQPQSCPGQAIGPGCPPPLTSYLWPSRCWFGKRPGVYTDYIYQGPMILVLLVRIWVGAVGRDNQSRLWTLRIPLPRMFEC